MFAEPSKLYEALSPILGLERLDDAARRLAQAVKDLSGPKAAGIALGRELKPRLAEVDDERARTASAQLRKQKPDLAAVRDLVTGDSPVDQQGLLSVLSKLAELAAPKLDVLSEAIAARQAAEAAAADVEQDEVQAGRAAADRRAHLLGLALELHDEDGEGPCPVCQGGQLDGLWAERVRTELAAGRDATARLTAARQELERTSRALTGLVAPPPAALVQARQSGRKAGVDAEAATALAAWQAWTDLTTPEDLTTAGEATLAALIEAVEVLTGRARSEREQRQDIWQPLALQLGEWLNRAEAAATVQQSLDEASAANTWLKDHAQELRNERLRPLAGKSRQIWALLRQESNVDLGEITLTGTNTRRRVELAASVDGREAGALAVMSQGELNALALSLFLPKATSPDSPFGFVVIDDPVQAMDPAKVDGLAQVLQAAAADRQVVVLTHDDRLPEAVRRLDIPATLIEVSRGAMSQVSITPISDPAMRYLDDARAVASDRNLPDEVRLQVVPELCRMGLEARCRDIYFTRQLRAGATRHDVENAWKEATTTRQRLALVVNADPASPLDPWLGNHRHRKSALGICTSAVHAGLNGRPHDAIDDVARALTDLDNARGR